MNAAYFSRNSTRSVKFWTNNVNSCRSYVKVLLFPANFRPLNGQIRFFHMSTKRKRPADGGDSAGQSPEADLNGKSPKQSRVAVNQFVNLLPSSSVFLQVLANGNCGYGKCIYLFTDTNRYLFNCPENVGRIMRSMPGFKIGRLQNVFLTHNNWWNVGGLPGLGITLKQSAVKEVNIHGSKNIELVFRSTNCIYDEEPPVKYIEKHYSLKNFEDESLTVDYIPLFGGKKTTIMRLNQDTNTSFLSKEKMEALNDDDRREVSVVYVCKIKQRPGRMRVEQCYKLGVPVGPLLGQLQKGMDVTLPNGKVVLSKDVMGEPDPPVNFAVVDVCDEHFLKSLLNSKQFDEYHVTDDDVIGAGDDVIGGNGSISQKPRLHLIVHYTDALIYQTDQYQQWMRRFGPDTQHLLVNQLAARLPHIDGMYKMEAQLNHINSEIFPLLRCHKEPVQYNVNLQNQVIPAEPFLIYHLRPFKKFCRDPYSQKDLSIEDCIKEMYDESPDLEETLKNYQQFLAEQKKNVLETQQDTDSTENKEYPEIIFLGTSSATQTKFRNVSGILMFIDRYHSILMDCGEGTYHQLYELYTDDEELYRVLSSIKLVFISHLHADHHMGLFTLLLKRKEAFDRLNLNFEPVYIVGPVDLFKIQYIYSQYVEDVMPLARRIPSNGENQPTNTKLAEIKRRMNLKSVTLIKVAHPKSAYALMTRLKDGTSILYSGDTLECNRLVDSGQDVDLLIHEATFDDTRVRDARSKYHCTVKQAVDVSQRMRAKFTLLTHFSTRYSSTPLFNHDTWLDKICVAFDFMRYHKSMELSMAKMLPVLKMAFQRHLEYNLVQQEKYECRLKRERDELKRKLQMELKQQQLKQQEIAKAVGKL